MYYSDIACSVLTSTTSDLEIKRMMTTYTIQEDYWQFLETSIEGLIGHIIVIQFQHLEIVKSVSNRKKRFVLRNFSKCLQFSKNTLKIESENTFIFLSEKKKGDIIPKTMLVY